MVWKTVTVALAALLASSAAPGQTAPETLGDRAALQRFARPTDIPYPPEDPYTDAKFELGKALFFDTEFSASRTRSCGDLP